MNQLTIDDAIAAGEAAMQRCTDKANRKDPEFSAKAEQAMLAHLAVVRECSGEDLVDIAMAHGAVPPDMRAFGGVFRSMESRQLIRCVRSDLPRKRGHGTSGGRLWTRVQ